VNIVSSVRHASAAALELATWIITSKLSNESRKLMICWRARRGELGWQHTTGSCIGRDLPLSTSQRDVTDERVGQDGG
jgi:hypothetical protein